jgi:hypothetical protein
MDEDNEIEPLSGEPNWADWCNVLLCIPFYLVKGAMRMLQGTNDLLDLYSRNIDAKKDFSNAVHEAIEHINDEDE